MDHARLDFPLVHVAQKLSERSPIKFVAIGSSSTAGAGASSVRTSYPAQLETYLADRFPDGAMRVLNRGINGEEVAQMVARFTTSVLAEAPDAVLWQVGTNLVLREHSINAAGQVLREGIAALKSTPTDIVLIDPQFAPRVIAKPALPDLLALLSTISAAEKVSVFGRFQMMRDWYQKARVPFETFLSPDGLHMNDWSYGCLARGLGRAIADAAKLPSHTIGAGRPKLRDSAQ